jgi:hypothetical protein
MRTGRSANQHLSVPRSHARSGVIGAWLGASAVIALGLACLPLVAGPSSASVITIGSTISNSALKSDRLTVPRTSVAPKSEVSKPGAIPVGCEAAFSKLVRVGNFTSRCVT